MCIRDSGIGLRPFYTDYWEERFTIEGSGYRGSINFIKDGSGFAAINMVDIDQYLYGVVSREMSESWPLEALKAQAICSRNYAAQNIGKHSSYGFDICANTHCQMYTGMSREAQSIYDAVDATRGQVMAYDGELCQLYYSSSMGSTTEDVKYVWGNEVPYLVSVDNSYEDTENIPNGVWSGVLTVEEASTLMRNKGYDVGDVQKIEALEYSPEGRVTKMCIRDRQLTCSRISHGGNHYYVVVHCLLNCRKHTAVSYTHLDVYKRQQYDRRVCAVRDYLGCSLRLGGRKGNLGGFGSSGCSICRFAVCGFSEREWR